MTLPEWKARAEPTLPSPVPENKSYGLIYKTKLSHWPFSNQLYVVNTFVSPILCKKQTKKKNMKKHLSFEILLNSYTSDMILNMKCLSNYWKNGHNIWWMINIPPEHEM